MFKKQEGITLVALVITIIVLLILAGVSISLVVGNNGVLTQASSAVVKNEAATALQEVQMAAADCQTAYYTSWATNSQVKKSSFYTKTAFVNNCQGVATNGVAVYLDTAISGTPADTGYVKVTYKAKSGTDYTFYADVSNGSVSTTAPSGKTFSETALAN